MTAKDYDEIYRHADALSSGLSRNTFAGWCGRISGASPAGSGTSPRGSSGYPLNGDTMSNRLLMTAIVLFVLVATHGGITAQTSDRVELDVVVLDGHDNPVAGLRESDFQI